MDLLSRLQALALADGGEPLRRALLAALPTVACAALLLLLLLQQISYLRKKGPLPGPLIAIPFLGSAIPMVTNPTRFWQVQASRARSSGTGLAADYLFGRFMVFISSTELSHKVFSNVRPDAFHLIIHPFGKRLFGDRNIAYLFGQDHKDLRRRIAPNFTSSALSAYVLIQQRVVRHHLDSWFEAAKASPERPTPLRLLCRDMNLEVSQTVFVGPYLTADDRGRFNSDFQLFNVGIMSLPIDLPGFAFRRARQTVRRLVGILGRCVTQSRERMRAGGEPSCMVDFWMQEEVAAGDETPDSEVGGHLYDFLFAAQDASTSSLLWAVALLDAHPDVLARVRAEVGALWDLNSGEPISAEQLRKMKYTEAVAKEVVRYRPPATMVPHVAAKDVKIADWYTVPKGTIVFPSALESSFQGFQEAEKFDPERFFLEGRQEDLVYRRNFLAFGAGPHQCVGQRYAVNYLHLFIAVFVSVAEFKRHRTDGCDDMAYVPTIVPKDDCMVCLSRR